MSRVRRLSPWYWMMLGALLVACGILVSDQFLDWAPKWLTFPATFVPAASSIYVFRMMWKQSDHPALHGDKSSTMGPVRANVADSSATPKPDWNG